MVNGADGSNNGAADQRLVMPVPLTTQEVVDALYAAAAKAKRARKGQEAVWVTVSIDQQSRFVAA